MSHLMKDLLPWYANDRLAPDKKQAVGRWLKDNPAAQAELDGLGHLRAVIAGQAQARPAEAVRQRVMARVAAGSRQPTTDRRPLTAGSFKRSRRADSRRPSAVSWAWGVGLALTVFVLLWAAIKPGVMLQWALSNGGVTAFQVYRAAEGSDEFALIGEVPTQAGADRYTFVDALSMPAANYTYVVKSVKPSGEATLSRAINASNSAALPSQVGILLASLIIGGGAAVLARERQFGDWGVGGLVS